MHIHFIGIGGAGIGPLAQTAFQAGYKVSGSDLSDSEYIEYLKKHGLGDIQIGQAEEILEKANQESKVDWLVYTAALTVNDQNPPVLVKAKELGIKTSKRDELINKIVADNNQKMIAIAGTHGKTTTTAMTVWLFKQLNLPISYILPAKTNFAEMGEFDKSSQFFVLEADEFDKTFLSFHPEVSIISGVSWDHHEIYPTEEEYKEAFRQFISQSNQTLLWKADADNLGSSANNETIIDDSDPSLPAIKLDGLFSRRDALLAVKAISLLTSKPEEELIGYINGFPGLSRRMEEIAPGLYSDYAHTPEKIRAAIDVVKDMTKDNGKKIIVVYEPLTNRRQTYIKDQYKDTFAGASKVYWLDSYLAREDPNTPIISPKELISGLSDPSIAEPAQRGAALKNNITEHLKDGDMVVAIAGGGSNSLDDWIRQQFGDNT